MTTETLLSINGVSKIYVPRTFLRSRRAEGLIAVDDVTVDLPRGKTLGVVGESGSGKTTLARMTAGILTPTTGSITIDDTDITRIPRRDLFRRIQYVYQDPYSALNPRNTVGRSIEVPLRFLAREDRASRQSTVRSLLDQVGLRPEMSERYPHELSGGQRQRVVIARAIAAHAETLVLDEPVSALDVSVQAQILVLLQELQDELGLTYFFISHDLAVIDALSHEVLVMRKGTVVERGFRDDVFTSPQHPYTRALLEATPGQSSRRSSARQRPASTGISDSTGATS